MYPGKRLKFLLDSLIYVREQIPDFEMIFIGSGSDSYLVEEMNQKNSWIHFLGPKFNDEKVPYFVLSKLFLMPAQIGLAILDCFALGVPLITTNYDGHGPEIDYLKTGNNGVIVDSPNNAVLFAQAIIDLFKNENARLKLVEGCQVSSSEFSIEKMVENFADGIELALMN